MKTTTSIVHLLHFFGIYGFAGLLAFVHIAPLAMGGLLTFAGAFFPDVSAVRKNDPSIGKAEFKMRNILFKLSGTLRFAVVCGGLILLVGSILDGQQKYVADAGQRLQKEASRLSRSLRPPDQLNRMIEQLKQGEIPTTSDEN